MKSKTRPPRSVGKVLLALGVVWTGLSLLFLVLGLRSIRSERQFQAESVVVPGIIVSKRVHEKNGIDPSTKRPTVSRNQYVTASFSDDRGQAREVETYVSAERWESAREDDAVEVRYLPADPARSRIDGKSPLGQAYLFTGLGGLGVLMGLGAAVSGRRNRGGIPTGSGKERR